MSSAADQPLSNISTFMILLFWAGHLWHDRQMHSCRCRKVLSLTIQPTL